MNTIAAKTPANSDVTYLKSYNKTPSNHTLIKRKAEFDFDADIPRFWQGEVFATRMLDAMQLAFPDGERMFIQSIRNYEDKITDPVLKRQVKEFIYQEAQHGIAHTEFTEMLTEQGLNVNGPVKLMKNMMVTFTDKAPKKVVLAATVAAEHLTASLGEFLVGSEDNMLTKAHPSIKAMYMWHGVEEVEHKAVAFDVYEQVAGGGYFTRALALAAIYPFALIPLTAGTMAMMQVDGELNVKELRKGVSVMFGKNGIFRKTFPAVMSYYKPSFHPWQSGYPANYHDWKAAYEESGDMTQAMIAVDRVACL
ncbi:MAG: metal-dependent hydrolase [Pseudomonadales bacterium]|nr:metal-dependent hydrolase [Pseudomonadales bacterium]